MLLLALAWVRSRILCQYQLTEASQSQFPSHTQKVAVVQSAHHVLHSKGSLIRLLKWPWLTVNGFMSQLCGALLDLIFTSMARSLNQCKFQLVARMLAILETI